MPISLFSNFGFSDAIDIPSPTEKLTGKLKISLNFAYKKICFPMVHYTIMFC